ncbi:hypothetical protein EC844_11498 [Acinetobacter calcoaceticus]|uniref:Uncharacterized protein n=1 Tax=Acinetobacter calcoaceticus TaxID=471 RepID=A0A4R1XRL5_ACICA|nr:hypothetical protein EC844_11498 [Acinetobacter calcoaceticus]
MPRTPKHPSSQQNSHPNKHPHKFLAPIVIAGITVGFLVSAYRFVFKTQVAAPEKAPQSVDNEPDSTQRPA